MKETEEMILRQMLWLNHGHTGMYGDDGEMQCAECLREYGFWDWKRTPAVEMQSRIITTKLRKMEKVTDE